MTRMLILALYVAATAMIGCGKKDEQDAKSKDPPAHANQFEGDGGTSTGDRPIQTASSGGASQDIDPELQLVQEMVGEVAELMAEAHRQEVAFDFEASISTWNKIHARITDQYGSESWQATNARLAIQTAEKRASMDFSQRKQMYELNSLEQQAEQLAKGDDHLSTLNARAQVCDLARRLWGPESYLSAGHLFKQAQSHQAVGQFPESETLMKKTLEIRERVMGTVHPEYISVLHALAILYQQKQAYELALPNMIESVTLCREVWGENSKPLATYYNDLGVLQYTVSNWADAEETLIKALNCYEAAGSGDSFDYAHCMFNLASVYFAASDIDRAESSFRTSLGQFLNLRSDDHEMVQQSRTQLATVLLIKQQSVEAESLLADVVQSRKRFQGELHPEYAKSLFQLGCAQGKQGKYELAEPNLREAYGLQSQLFPPSDPAVKRTGDTLVIVLRKRGLDSEADNLEHQLQIAAQPNRNPIR